MSQRVVVVDNTSGKPLEGTFQTLTEVVSSTITYHGECQRQAATETDPEWRIYVIHRVGTVVHKHYAGNGNFEHRWSERSTLFESHVQSNNYSVLFDGVNDYIDFGDNYDFTTATAFSISFWVKPQNLAAQRTMISKCSADANVYGYNIYHTATAGTIVVQHRSPAALNTGTFSQVVTAGVWQNIVLTYTGSQLMSGWSCYKNGVIGTSPAGAAAGGDWTNSASFIVGNRNTSQYFSGNIDEVCVWNKALNQSEVTELYNTGLPADILQHSASSNCLSWWRMGDNDTYPIILDHKDSINGTMTNMTVASIVADVP